jgi:hypothetical protein
MNRVPDFLWPIILFGSCGGFIDFLIGKTGQEGCRNWLLKWWVKFDDIRWNNFGRKEGMFAARLISRLFGERIWSRRRIGSGVLLMMIVLSLVIFRLGVFAKPDTVLGVGSSGQPAIRWCDYCGYNNPATIIPALIASLISFCLSVSFTKVITIRMADLCGSGQLRNFIVFACLLIINYLMLVFWLPTTYFFKTALAENWYSGAATLSQYLGLDDLVFLIWTLESPTIFYLRPLVESFMRFYEGTASVGDFSTLVLSSFPNVCRLLISIVFVGSFLLKPLIMRPVSLVWERIIESDRPIFTLIFGGAAAFATAASEVARHL